MPADARLATTTTGVDPDALKQFFAGHGGKAAPKHIARKSRFALASCQISPDNLPSVTILCDRAERYYSTKLFAN